MRIALGDDDLYSQCESELKTLINAKKTPDDYQQIHSKLAGCLENIMSEYREEDREIIAHYIVSVFSEMSEEYNLSPIAVLCLSQILHLIRQKSKPLSFNQGITVSN